MVSRRFSHLLVVGIAVLTTACSTAPKQQADLLQQAQIAFDTKDYSTSYKLLVPLAKAGNPKAEYALGYQYYNGLGVTTDLMVGKIWIRKAALQNYEPAKTALTAINELEQKYALAETNGETPKDQNKILAIQDSANPDLPQLSVSDQHAEAATQPNS